MRIQEAVRACQGKEGLFARPRSWSGTGTAVDLGRHLSKERCLKIVAISASAATGKEWDMDPEDLLLGWELVELSRLAEENSPKSE